MSPIPVGGAFRFAGPVTGSVADSTATASWMGKAADDSAGWSVFGGVDADSDGFSDLAVGAPGLDQFTLGLSDVGGGYLVRGTGQ